MKKLKCENCGANSKNDSNDIKNLKQKLEDKDYEVVFDYDKDGFINKITLEDI